MSSCVVWSIPREVIESAIHTKLKLETQPTVWAAGFDDAGGYVNIAFEIDEGDIEALGLNMDDMECSFLDDGEFVQ